MGSHPLIVGVSGASGVLYAVRLLEQLRLFSVPVHAVFSRHAYQTLSLETDFSPDYVHSLCDVVYANTDMAAPIASGSFLTAGMVVVPCSIKTLSGITYGYDSTLLTRAADVCLKEKRRLILMVRETPLHTGHLETMMKASSYGAIIFPPMPAFYLKPQNIDAIVQPTVSKILDLFSIEHTALRWGMEPLE